MELNEQEKFLYGNLTARVRRMLEPYAHDSFIFFEDTIRLLEPEIQSGGKVFDAGCGRGTLSAWFADSGCYVTAIDSSEVHIRQTADLLESKGLSDRVHLEVSHLPDSFPQDRFDVVVDCFSWWHISDWGRLFNLSRKNLNPEGKLLILDKFFSWNTTLEFRQEMRELWNTAIPTWNECRNMLIKRDFRLLKAEAIQDAYIRYLEAVVQQIHELQKEDLGSYDTHELDGVKSMWEWFLAAAKKEEVVASVVVAELTHP